VSSRELNPRQDDRVLDVHFGVDANGQDLSFVVHDVTHAKVLSLTASLERVLARKQVRAQVRVDLVQRERSTARPAAMARSVTVPRRTVSRPLRTARPRARISVVRRRSSGSSRRSPGRLADDPEPLGSPWRGFLAASVRLHAHVQRRAAAARVA
jgi:hypothetical protein